MKSFYSYMENLILYHGKTTSIIIYNAVTLISAFLCWIIIPVLLNYPPDFSKASDVIGSSTIAQYSVFLIITAVSSVIFFNRELKGIDKWEGLIKEKPLDVGKIHEIRKKCMNLPTKIFFAQIIILNTPILIVLMTVSLFNRTSLALAFKIVIIVMLLSFMSSVILYAIFSRVFKVILLKTYIGHSYEGCRLGIKSKIMLQLLPLGIAAIFFTSLIGYSRLIEEKDDLLYSIYINQLASFYNNQVKIRDSEHMLESLKIINYENTRLSYFVRTSDGQVKASNDFKMSKYLLYYIDNPFEINRIFDLDMGKQGIVFEFNTEEEGMIKAGVIFKVASDNMVILMFFSLVILVLLQVLMHSYVLKTLSYDIKQVTNGLEEMIENEVMDVDRQIAVTSNDEIGDLVVAFNKIMERQHEYDKLKSEFMANISHELKTPINVIYSAIQLSELYGKSDTDICDKMGRNLKTMKKNCLRLMRLINNLIDTTKLDAGYLKLKKNKIDIVAFIKETISNVAVYAKSKDIKLAFSSDTDKKIMNIDIEKIETIILNLLSNAIKFTRPGGSIYTSMFDREDGIVISIKDTGIGIPKDKQKIIFERFRQVENPSVNNLNGSGIGLYLVKSYVELHGGTVSLASDVGKGSEFIIELPAGNGGKGEPDIDFLNAEINMIKDKLSIELSDVDMI